MKVAVTDASGQMMRVRGATTATVAPWSPDFPINILVVERTQKHPNNKDDFIISRTFMVQRQAGHSFLEPKYTS